MVVLVDTTAYAGWLGWQWRRTRTIGNDIKALKAQVPQVSVMAGGAAPAPAPTTELRRQIAALEQVLSTHSGVMAWAAAAALVPAMQKGDDNARNAHIALNAVNLALFAWQLPTGWEIVLKVFQFTSWL
eukprot:jgi/Chrzof1/10985/Cz05g19180.t1